MATVTRRSTDPMTVMLVLAVVAYITQLLEIRNHSRTKVTSWLPYSSCELAIQVVVLTTGLSRTTRDRNRSVFFTCMFLSCLLIVIVAVAETQAIGATEARQVQAWFVTLTLLTYILCQNYAHPIQRLYPRSDLPQMILEGPEIGLEDQTVSHLSTGANSLRFEVWHSQLAVQLLTLLTSGGWFSRILTICWGLELECRMERSVMWSAIASSAALFSGLVGLLACTLETQACMLVSNPTTALVQLVASVTGTVCIWAVAFEHCSHKDQAAVGRNLLSELGVSSGSVLTLLLWKQAQSLPSRWLRVGLVTTAVVAMLIYVEHIAQRLHGHPLEWFDGVFLSALLVLGLSTMPGLELPSLLVFYVLHIAVKAEGWKLSSIKENASYLTNNINVLCALCALSVEAIEFVHYLLVRCIRAGCQSTPMPRFLLLLQWILCTLGTSAATWLAIVTMCTFLVNTRLDLTTLNTYFCASSTQVDDIRRVARFLLSHQLPYVAWRSAFSYLDIKLTGARVRVRRCVYWVVAVIALPLALGIWLLSMNLASVNQVDSNSIPDVYPLDDIGMCVSGAFLVIGPVWLVLSYKSTH